MNNIGSAEKTHGNENEEQASPSEAIEVPKNDETNRKLGSFALSRDANERILPEVNRQRNNVLRADDELSREMNTMSVQGYLNEVDIDPNLAGALFSSGVFDTVGNPAAYKVSIRQGKDKKGQPYLRSLAREKTGYSFPTGHEYKIFEYDGLLAVYDSQARLEDRHYVMDELPYDKEPSFDKYKIEKDEIVLIEPNTGEPIALGKYGYDTLASLAPTDTSIENINDESLIDSLEKFDFRIIDSERFDELAGDQAGGNSIVNEIKNSIAKQEEKAEARRKAKEETEKKRQERELDKNIENEIAKSGILESVVNYVKNKRLIMKFIKNNDGHINMIELPMGNYQMHTDLKKEQLNLPDGMSLKAKLYGPAEGERQYDVLNGKDKKIGVLNGRE